jgi:transcriptional regulator with XRE-family HTH domain
MTKKEQESFYAKVGRYLTVARERKKLSVSQLAKKAGEQFNTVSAIEEGKNFHFHQVVWIAGVLGVDVNVMIREIMEGNNERNELADFI